MGWVPLLYPPEDEHMIDGALAIGPVCETQEGASRAAREYLVMAREDNEPLSAYAVQIDDDNRIIRWNRVDDTMSDYATAIKAIKRLLNAKRKYRELYWDALCWASGTIDHLVKEGHTKYLSLASDLDDAIANKHTAKSMQTMLSAALRVIQAQSVSRKSNPELTPNYVEWWLVKDEDEHQNAYPESINNGVMTNWKSSNERKCKLWIARVEASSSERGGIEREFFSGWGADVSVPDDLAANDIIEVAADNRRTSSRNRDYARVLCVEPDRIAHSDVVDSLKKVPSRASVKKTIEAIREAKLPSKPSKPGDSLEDLAADPDAAWAREALKRSKPPSGSTGAIRGICLWADVERKAAMAAVREGTKAPPTKEKTDKEVAEEKKAKIARQIKAIEPYLEEMSAGSKKKVKALITCQVEKGLPCIPVGETTLSLDERLETKEAIDARKGRKPLRLQAIHVRSGDCIKLTVRKDDTPTLLVKEVDIEDDAVVIQFKVLVPSSTYKKGMDSKLTTTHKTMFYLVNRPMAPAKKAPAKKAPAKKAPAKKAPAKKAPAGDAKKDAAITSAIGVSLRGMREDFLGS